MTYLLSGALMVSLIGATLIAKMAIEKESKRIEREHIGWIFYQFDENNDVKAMRFYFQKELQESSPDTYKWYYDPFAHVDDPLKHKTYWKVRGVDWDNIILYYKIRKTE